MGLQMISEPKSAWSRDRGEGTTNDFLSTILLMSRPIVEWLAWQYQQYNQLAKGGPMMYCHAEELDNNEHAEVNRVLEFMGIAPQAHPAKKVVTATVSFLLSECCMPLHHLHLPLQKRGL